MKPLLLSIFLLSISAVNAQQLSEEDSVVAEGKHLYRLETASWYGTDLFVAAYKKTEHIGGYFSYPDHQNTTCVFVSDAREPMVIGTIHFNSNLDPKTAKVDLTERQLSREEQQLLDLRMAAMKLIQTDTLFKRYQNVNFNPVPLINSRERKVYILSGTQQNGIVLFGNDYLITFDTTNTPIQKKPIHKSLIPIKYGKEEDGNVLIGGAHSHLPETGDLITATDICTLMLYQKLTKWDRYYIIGPHAVCIWDCRQNQLATMTREAFDNLTKEQKKQ